MPGGQKAEMVEYKSFYKTVSGNEGTKCRYPTRLDTYGCGCSHNCSYCYARSLLEFRGLWIPERPAVADIDKIRRKLEKVKPGTILRLGGMTDCFQPAERAHRITYQTILELNRGRIGYLIVTKSAMAAEDDYINISNRILIRRVLTREEVEDICRRNGLQAQPVEA